MHHHKVEIAHDRKKEVHGKKDHGHGRHGRHREGFSKKKCHKKIHGDYSFQSEHSEFKKGKNKVLDFNKIKSSRDFRTEGQDFQGDTGLKVSVDLERCVRCGKCQRVCPTEAIMVDEEIFRIDSKPCNGCGWCVENCKNGALSLVEGKEAVMN